MNTTDNLRAIDPKDIPPLRETRHSALRRWADETAAAFLASDLEAAEVSGWPEGGKADQAAAKLREAVYNASGRANAAKVMQRKGRVFMQQPPKAGKVIAMPESSKRRVKMPKSSAGLNREVR